jgi:tight adherence protein B
MTEPWVIYFLIFAAVFTAVQFSFGYLTGELRSRKRATSRLAQATRGNRSESERNEAQAIWVAQQGNDSEFSAIRWFRTLVLQSGLRLKHSTVLLIYVVAAFVAFVVSGFLPVPFELQLVLSVLLPLGSLVLALKVLRARRMKRFGEQLPEVIDIIVRSLRAGHPLTVSLALVAREMPGPAGPEFSVTSDEITYGRDVRSALGNLYQRVGYDDLRFLVAAISVQHQTGGNLGEILSRLSKLLRDRFRMRRKIHSLSSEGRFSAVALSLLPFVVYLLMSVTSPDYFNEVWGHPVMTLAFGLAGVLLLIGNFVMYKMVNFKY